MWLVIINHHLLSVSNYAIVTFNLYLIIIILYNNNFMRKKNHANGNINIIKSFLNLIDQEETVSFNLIMMKSVTNKWSIVIGTVKS